MRDNVFKNFIMNCHAAFSMNVRRRINENARQIESLKSSLLSLESNLDSRIDEKFHYLNVLEYYACHVKESGAYLEELEFLQKMGRFCNFPYPLDTTQQDVASGFDESLKLPFVVHKGKRLYFPSNYSITTAVGTYLNYVQNEKLLGLDDHRRSPHQYQSPNVCVQENDVVIDIGSAEGLFALEYVDIASKVVIVESDGKWIEPLRHTFAPFGEKVTIVEKFVSAVDTDNTISLNTLLSSVDCCSAFIKMDIEGEELPSIISAGELLKEKNGIKISAATYHRQHDADDLKAFFDSIGYVSEFSDGFMLFHLYDFPAPPFFRKGIIRAKSSY